MTNTLASTPDYIDPAIGWPIAAILWGILIIHTAVTWRKNK